MIRRSVPVAILLAGLLTPIAIRAQDPPRVLMISIDGMMPAIYGEPTPAKIPTLRRLASEGARARGVIGVLPTVTFPSHTTLITGVLPAVHGIIDNRFVDPENRSSDAWYWYARDIRTTTLLGAASAAGLRTASIFWPVTVGADVDVLFPEYYRSSHPENLSLLRALSTPNLIDAVEVRRGGPLPWPFTDDNTIEIASFVAETYKPDLMLVHLIDLDDAQHETGPGSSKSLEAIERIDGLVAKLISSFAGGDVVVAIVSDHGFLPLEHVLQPNALFKQEGLITVDERGRVTDWQAYFHASGGSGFVYLKDPGDRVLRTRVGALLRKLAADPANGVRTVWDAAQLKIAGAHPEAAFGLDMRNGYYSARGHGVLLEASETKGGHGFSPDRPELHASLILHGGPFRRGTDLGIVRMTQVAPTLAKVLGIRLSEQAADQTLPLPAAR